MKDNKRGSARQRKRTRERTREGTRMERTISAAVQGSALCGNKGSVAARKGTTRRTITEMR